MRIIIFTDSMGRARPDIDEIERTYYEDVYGYKLKKYFDKDEVELIYVESLDTQDAIHWSQRMVAFRRPDLVIFHIGINDCVPRLFSKGNCKIVFNPIFRKITKDFFIKLFSYFRYKITKVRPLVYVPKESFRNNLKEIMTEIKKYSPKCNFMAIGIAKSELLNKKSYGFNRNVEEYNKILKEIFGENFIDINRIFENNFLISDGLHLKKESHQVVFEVLVKKIEEVKQ